MLIVRGTLTPPTADGWKALTSLELIVVTFACFHPPCRETGKK